MKNSFRYAYFLVPLLVQCCHKEVMQYDQPGKLKISIGMSIQVNEVKENLKSTNGVEDFRVTVCNPAGAEILAFAKASEMPEEISLDAGSYYVVAHSDNNLPAAFDNPYYYGQSDLFTITPLQVQSVSVNCELANTIVSIVYSDNLQQHYSDYSTTVSSSAGSLVFAKGESRRGYFQPLPLDIHVLINYQQADGSPAVKTLTGHIPDPQPKRHYEVHVDAAPGAGSALLQISMNEAEVPVEVVNVSDGPGTASGGDLAPGSLLITEIMYNPSAMTDATGEWFEIYNNTTIQIDLHNLVIRKDNAESHVIGSEVILQPQQYYVLARTDNAVIGNKYVYGTGISLNNTGAVLSVCNYGTDRTNGSVICAVDYGADGFPSGTGASICLDPDLFNPADMILGDSWCTSVSAYQTGDLGTPGEVNDSCD
jgi:hypothetical protein